MYVVLVGTQNFGVTGWKPMLTRERFQVSCKIVCTEEGGGFYIADARVRCRVVSNGVCMLSGDTSTLLQ